MKTRKPRESHGWQAHLSGRRTGADVPQTMDGRSINKINGGDNVFSAQMKAAAACLLDIHGQHEHQSLLYGDRQLAILDVYGKEQILPAREKVRKAYQEYRDCVDQLKALDMDEEQRNREKAFLEFEINVEIERQLLFRERTKHWRIATGS